MTDISPAKQAVLDALNSERYGPSLWWKAPAPADDHEIAQCARRRLMEQDFDESRGAS